MQYIKDIIFNPTIAGLVIGILAISILILFNFSRKEKFSRKLETVMVFLWISLLMEIRIFPFATLKPLALVDRDKTLSSAAAQIGIYLFFIVLLSTRFRDFLQNSLLVLRDPFLAILLLLSALSGFWSETPDLSLKGGLGIVVISLFTVHIAKHYSLQEITALFRWIAVWTILPSIFVAVAIPSFGFEQDKGGWMGIMRHPIALGTFSALSIVLWLCHFFHTKKERIICIGAIFISAIALIGSRSVQAMLVLVVLMSILVIQQLFNHLKFRQVVFSSILLSIIGICTASAIWLNLNTVVTANGRDLTLTGRTEFWPQVIQALNEGNPIFGYGYRGFWQEWRGSESPARHIINANGFVPPNAHNGFLDIAVQLGYLGLCLFLLSLLAIVIRSLLHAARFRTTESIVPLLFIVYIIMANLSETQIYSDIYTWFMYVFLAVSPDLRFKQKHLSISLPSARQNESIY